MPIKTILVPLDGSTFAEWALHYAVPIANAAKASLHVAVVHEPMPIWALKAGSGSDETQARVAERAYLDAMAESLRGRTGGRVQADLLDAPDADALQTFAVKQGFSTDLLNRPVAAALAAYALERVADLVVLSTHGRGSLSRAWMGSVADQLVRQLHRPVLMVRPPEGEGAAVAGPIRRILIAVDGSPFSQAAVARAAELGSLLGASYRVLRVVEDTWAFPNVSLAGPVDLADEGGLLEAARRDVAGIVAGLRAAGHQADGEAVVAENAARAILESAGRGGADAIALSTHGTGGLRRVLLGTVADRIIRSAAVPVLVVRPA